MNCFRLSFLGPTAVSVRLQSSHLAAKRMPASGSSMLGVTSRTIFTMYCLVSSGAHVGGRVSAALEHSIPDTAEPV